MPNLPSPAMPEAELRRRVRRGEVAGLLRLLLDGRPPAQVLVSEFQRQRVWDSKGWQPPLAWREQVLADLAGVAVPAAERAAAEEAWQAEPEPVRGRTGLIDAGPVRQHARALADAGLDARSIAEAGGMTPIGINRLLQGVIRHVMADQARRLLAMRMPDADRDTPGP